MSDSLPIQVAGPTGSAVDTSIGQAQLNTFYSVSQLVKQLNQALATNFQTQWDSWVYNYSGGHQTLDAMPHVPKSYVVAYFNDPTTGTGDGAYPNIVVQWAYPAQTGGPVIPQPTPPATQPPTPTPQSWFSAVGGDVQVAPLGDTTPVGVTVTDATGQKWIKKSNPTPFGVAYWYEKVK